VKKHRKYRKVWYTAIEAEVLEVNRRSHPNHAKMGVSSVLTDKQRADLISKYPTMHRKRTELAKEMGLPKIRLNFEIELLRQLGCIKGESA
jgi:hypothetical protein